MCSKCNKCNTNKCDCNCGGNSTQPCCTDKKLDLKNTIYSGETLVPFQIEPGMSGEDIIRLMNEFIFDTLIDIQLSAVDIVNTGNGFEIYKGVSPEGTHDFRTLERTGGILITQTEDTIRFSIDPQWLQNVVNNQLTTIVRFIWSSQEEMPLAPITNGEIEDGVWHEDYRLGDPWMAIQEQINGEVQPWKIIRVKGQPGNPGQPGDPGEPGPPGPRGTDGTNGTGTTGAASYTSIVFKRAGSQPATPTGGSYALPVPSGWSDGIPAETNGFPVWMSTRVFTTDGQAPQQNEWDVPTKVADTADIDFEFSSYTGLTPGVPSPTPTPGVEWHNDGRIDDIWMAIRKRTNGQFGDWSVIKIKGEDGTPGIVVMTSNVFIRAATQPAAPTTGSYSQPVPTGWSDGIPPESNGYPVWMSTRKFTSDGNYPQQAVWSTPVKIADTSEVDFEFSDYPGVNPGTPSSPIGGATWHNLGQNEDIWMAMRTLSNGLGGPWSVIKIKGEDGTPSGGFQGVMTSFAFLRSVSQPATPTGGSYASPTPSGWSDGIPPGVGKVWMTTRIFTTDGVSPQEAVWNTPIVAVDNMFMDYAYAYSSSKPSPPASTQVPHQDDATWHNDPLETDNWQAMRPVTNGLYGNWVINKIKGEVGPEGPQGGIGPIGISGTRGPIPRTFEWVEGTTYENGGEYIDYVYFRVLGTDTGNNMGWYTVKKTQPEGTATTRVANVGIPDSGFNKELFTAVSTFGTVIAEQANLAGFIFRNQVLYSGAKGYQTCTTTNDRGPFHNLTIDGLNGTMKFLERMFFSKDGIELKDDCGNKRMEFAFIGGVPILKFYNANGSVSWEAGKDGYKPTYIETRPEAFLPFKAFYQAAVPTAGSVSATLRAVFRNNTCASASGGYNYNNNGFFASLGAVGYMYDKGVKAGAYTPEEDAADLSYFATQNYAGAFITDGYYMTGFMADTVTGNPGNYILRTDWSHMVNGKITEELHIDYDLNSIGGITTCTTQQEEQWEAVL